MRIRVPAAHLKACCRRPSSLVISRTAFGSQPPRKGSPSIPSVSQSRMSSTNTSTSSPAPMATGPGGASPAPSSSTSPLPGNAPSAISGGAAPLPTGSGAGAGGAAPGSPSSPLASSAKKPQPTVEAASDLADGAIRMGSPNTTSTDGQQQQQQTATSSSSSSAAADDPQPAQPHALPALPAPEPDGSGATDPNGGLRTVVVNGQAVALDNLGPMVVGRDGTVSRIANWGEMAEIERENTLRILCRRNQLRLANLRAGLPADQPRVDADGAGAGAGAGAGTGGEGGRV